MKIYFAASVRGGRAHQPTYKTLVDLLGQMGTVLNRHVADEAISDYGETDLTKQQIHEREIQSLEQADLVVAEVTTPSLGVGYLVARALDAGKRVVCLYHGENTHKLSAMIKGDTRVKVVTYKEPDELRVHLSELLGSPSQPT